MDLQLCQFFSPIDVSTHCLTYSCCRGRGLIQYCPWKTLCYLLPTPVPSNPVLAYCWWDCRVNQNRDKIEISGDKQREQGWAESLKVYAIKGEEMVEGQEPAQGGRSSFGGNTSRSGSRCLGKLVLWRSLVLCLNGSRSRISPRVAPSPCHGTWAEINAKMTLTPRTLPGTEGRGTFWWQFLVHQFVAV